MNYPELITRLCGVIDQQNVIIQAQAMELGQLAALTDAEREAIAATRREYAAAMGEEVDV